MLKKACLKITLNSDLCVSSGQAYAGIVDTEICVDGNGFPYIPAKRLKGVLREAAEFLYPESVEELFGRAGAGYDDSNHLSVFLKNAYIDGMRELGDEIVP